MNSCNLPSKRYYKRMQNHIRFPHDVATLPTAEGSFRIFVADDEHGREHVVLVSGDLDTSHPVLVRVHSECFTGDTIGSLRCDCNQQLHMALKRIGAEGGVLLYLRQEGRGIGLANKVKAYALQEQGRDTVQANEDLGLPVDARHYDVAACILREMGISSIRLMTNNPEKVEELQELGITVAERIPIEAVPGKYNSEYMHTKKVKLGHLFQDSEV